MKMLYHKIILSAILIALLQAVTAVAQTAKSNAKISGSVLDDKSAPMPYATVALLKAKDSTLVKGTVTSDAGVYKFDRVGVGSYVIRVTAMGFAKANSKAITISQDDANIKVPAMQLGNSSKTLKEVSITSTKPLIERKLDRTVMNVENSVLAAGNSAMDILEKAPGVSIDKDDNISLKGKQGVTIMLDGKLTYLSSAQLATLLRSTDGSTIQSIELITNPSAKYDASGNSGIINIKTKKNKMSGTNGSVTVGGGYGAYPKDNESININHKEGALNVFGSFSHNDRQRANTINIDRLIDTGGKKTYFTQRTFMPQTNHNNSYRVGADYDITPKNSIGFIVSGYFNKETDNNASNTLIGANRGVADSLQNTASTLKQSYNNFALNLNDKYQIDKNGQELSVDMDYSKFNNTNDAIYNNSFLLSNGATQKSTIVLTNQSPSSIRITTANVDYTLPLNKTVKLETGAKISDVKTDNNLQAQINKGNSFINDTTRTNHFIYDETLLAGYVNLSKTYKNSSVQIGLRAENTSSTGNLVTKNQVVDRQYLDFFPSVFLNHNFSEKNELGFSYSRRIDRPSYDNLNPFIYYLDQYTYSQGNPFLKPQYTNSFELSYTYNKTVNATLGYSHTSDVITEIILTNSATKATYQTHLNLQSQNAYNININTPYTFTKWWTGNVNLNTYYLGFKSTALAGGNLNAGQVSVQFKTTETFQITKTFRFEAATNYQSPQTYGIYHIEARYWADAGVSKTFADKMLNVKFSVNDVFNTQRNNVSSMYQSTNFSIHQKNETQIFRLNLTYNFGNSKFKAKQHSTNSDEKNRVNTGN